MGSKGCVPAQPGRKEKIVSSKTPSQILAGYMQRLQDRQDWLHEKINILKENKKPFGYEQEEFFATRWALEFIARNPELALEHVTKDLSDRAERK